MKAMIAQFGLPLIRHGLTSAGGALVAGGYLDASQAQTVTGALLALAGVGLSMWDKRGRS
jgi:hypothetical protein